MQGDLNDSGTATWTFTGLIPGKHYRVGVTYPNPPYYPVARYEIRDENRLISVVSRDQYRDPVDEFAADGADWDSLGFFEAQGTTLTVTLSRSGGTRAAFADAIRVDEIGFDSSFDDDFHLASDSPGIDAGDPLHLFFNEPSPNGDRINLGAYGNTSEATASNSQTLQIISPANLNKWTVGDTETIEFRSSGLAENRSLIGINAGGGSVGTIGADQYVSYGEAVSATEPIDLSLVATPLPDEIYTTYRRTSYWYGQPTPKYSLPIPAGNYTVRLHFVSVAGTIPFNILLQGDTVESNINLVTQAGGANRAIVKEFPVLVGDDNQGILLQIYENADGYAGGLAAIEVLEQNANGSADRMASIDISTDSGASWTEIADSVSLDHIGVGRFDWTIPESFATAPAGAKARIRSGSLTALSGAFSIVPAGNEYFVNIAGDTDFSDNQYTTAAGDDRAHGKSPDVPMASIAAVLLGYDLEPGDIIYVDSGDYRLTDNIRIGSADSGVLITGPTDADKVATIDRANTNSGADAFDLMGVNSVTIQHLEITGANIGIWTSASALSNNISIRDNRIFGNVSGIYTGDGGSQIVIQGNTIFDNSGTGIHLRSDQSTVSDNRVFSNNSGIATNYPAAGIEIFGNEVSANTSVGISAYGASTIVSGNQVYGQRIGNAAGISLSEGAIARDNIVYDNSRGFSLYRFPTVESNLIYANGYGIYGIDSYGTRIAGNKIFSNDRGVVFVPNGSYRRNYPIVESNVIYANAVVGVYLTGSDSSSKIRSNTIYQPAGNAIYLANAVGAEVTENIIRVDDGAAIAVSADAQVGFASDYNLFVLGDAGIAGLWAGRELTDHPDWMFSLGYDQHGLQTDPMFVDIDGPDDVLGFSTDIVSSQVIDDGDPGFSTTGTWNVISTAGYSGDYQQGTTADAGTATWTFTGLVPGNTYRLGVTYPTGYYYPLARYEIRDENHLISVISKNQYNDAPDEFEVDSSLWDSLGIFTAQGTSLTVTLQDNGGSRFAFADAMRLDQIVGESDRDDDFHLLPGSPGVDRGDPQGHYLFEPLPNGNRINLGAYGGTSEATPSDEQTVQLLSPNGLEKWTVGNTEVIRFRSSGLTADRTVLAMNVGGGATSNWEANQYLTSGSGITNSVPIDLSAVNLPAPESVYQSYVRGLNYSTPLRYEIPLLAGQYQLRLHFVSTSNIAFDLSIQDQLAESNMQPLLEAGNTSNKALLREFPITVLGDEGLSIQMKSLGTTFSAEGLAGIEILQASPIGSTNPTASIDISTDDGTTWSEIATGVPMDTRGWGSFDWTIPHNFLTTGATAIARVRSGNVSGTSEAGFLITPSGNEFYINIANDGDLSDNQYTTASGDDTASGKSPDAPMASLTALLNAYDFEPGDVVYVDTGNYFPFGNIKIGAEDSGVRITGPTDVDRAAIFNRGNTVSGSYVFELAGTDGVTIEHLGITGAQAGVALNQNADNTNVTIRNNDFFANTSYGLFSHQRNDGVLIDSNDVHEMGSYGIYVQGGGATVTNNRVYSNPIGIRGSGVGVSVTGNEVFSNSGTGVAVTNSAVAQNNVVYDHRTSSASVGISVGTSSEANDNIVYENQSGISIFEGSRVSSNRIFGNNIGIAGSRVGAQIDGNAIYSNSEGIYLSESYNRIKPRIESNLIYDNSNRAIYLYGGNGNGEITIIGNTIYQEVGDAIQVTYASNVRLRNNIIAVDNGAAINIATNAVSGFEGNYNLIDLGAGTGAAYGVFGATAAPDLAAWQAATGGSANSLVADPLLLDINGIDNVLGYENGVDHSADDNFVLAKNSPAIDRGQSWVLSTDYLGSPSRDDIATANEGSIDYFGTTVSDLAFQITGTAQNRKTTGTLNVPFTLPFAFPFFDQSLTGTVYLTAQGLLQFASSSNWSETSDTQFSSQNHNRITALWQDIHTGGPGDDIFIDDSVADQVSFYWDATARDSGADVKFGVRLFADGAIEFLYGDTAGLNSVAGIAQSSNAFPRFASSSGSQASFSNKSVRIERLPGIVDIGALEFRGESSDATAPLIAQTTPSALDAGGQTSETIDSIQIQFSEEVNYFDAGSFAAYELREAGANGTFGDGDDIVYDLVPSFVLGDSTVDLQIVFDAGTTTAVGAPLSAPLGAPGGAYLPEGHYQFVLQSDATGSVRDTAGLSTDGDGDGAAGGIYLREFEVAFVPTISSVQLTPMIDEGGSVMLTGELTDLSSATDQTLTVNWGDGTNPVSYDLNAGDTTFSIQRAYGQDSVNSPDGKYAVSVSVANNLGRQSVYNDSSLATTVNNVTPVLPSIVAPAAIDEGVTFTLVGTLTDPGLADTHTLSIDWGEGLPLQEVTLPIGDRTFSVPHTYTNVWSALAPIETTITVTLKDDGPITVDSAATIWITPENAAPVIQDTAFTVDEAVPDGTVVGQLSNQDPDLVLPNVDTQVFSIRGGTGLGRFEIDNNGVITVIDGASLNHHQTASYSLIVEVTDAHGAQDSSLVTIQVRNVVEIDAVTIGDGTNQRSIVRAITVDFDAIVTLESDAILIETADGNSFAPLVTTSSAAGRTTVQLTFDSLHTDLSGSLINGDYRLKIQSAKISSDDSPMRSDRVDAFYRFFGDSDGDRDVDAQDYGQFGLSFLKSEGDANYNPAFDYDQDGDVDGQDYGRFEANFMKRL
ncbi:MAG: right-handed parallel beta-helix repeat-containing protein [Planctomycetales bacterium]|nr:right-handed parallel beta-helix repeat-containing protein [Planctomycetales bacterium]